MYRILFVDDSETQRLSLRMSLSLRGFEVILAEDGQEAWGIFQTKEFNAVLTDYDMPHMDGLELIQRIRKSGSKVPIILYCATWGLEIPAGIVHLSKNDPRTLSFDFVAQQLRNVIEPGGS